MKRQHNIEKKDSNLIFDCDCNNNVIDKVSGYDLFVDLLGGTVAYNPLYVVDPLDNTRYCIKKRSGAYRVPLHIGDYTRTNTITSYNTFVISNSSGVNDPNETVRAWLASPTYGDHMVEFYWYCASGTYSTSTTIFDSSGLANQNSNSNYSGVALITRTDNYIVIRCRNNTSTNIDTVVGTRSSLAGKWYKCQFTYHYISSTIYGFEAKIYDGDNLIAQTSNQLKTPLADTKTPRYYYCFLCDNAGSGNWAPNTIDCIKDVKVYKVQNQ